VAALFRESFRRTAHRSFHDQICHAFIKLHLPGLLLMLDATSMAASVEARTPFLDYRLVERAFALPAHYKLRWKSWRHFCRALGNPPEAFSEREDTTKWILRELYREELPREVLEREKMPFHVPLSTWFTQLLRPRLQQELLADTARISDIFDLGKLRRWMERAEDGLQPGYGRQVWLMLSLELWLRQYT
jgi:asparagine synthase (glutamine-hydrolysing)